MAQAETSSPQATDCSNESESSKNQRLEYAASRARLLFGCYRKGDANDPETYVAAVTAILADYEPAVIKRVTDPRTGIARKIKFMPNPAEVAEECELAKKIVAGERLIAERAAKGFKWIDDRQNGQLGFYNGNGVAYGAEARAIAPPIGAKRMAEVKIDARPMDQGPAPEPRDDGRHYMRIAEDIEARRARNAVLAASTENEQKTA